MFIVRSRNKRIQERQAYQDFFLTVDSRTRIELETSMKNLFGVFILCGTLTLLAGEALAKEVVPLNCEMGECKFSEELGPDQTKEYRGVCARKPTVGYKMVCHAVKGTTCTLAAPLPSYRSCTCTNWNATKRKNVSIDLLCEY